MTGTTPFFQFLLFALATIILVYLYRVVKGPTVFDRVLGLNGIATKAIILLVAIGTAYQRVEMFVDISTGYALLNMVSALAVAKYMEGRGARVIELAAMALMTVGLFFLLVGAIGVVRFPDVFSRSHAVGLTDSVGALFTLSGLALYQGFNGNMVRVLMVLALLYVLNPVMTHAMLRAALRSGLRPWTKGDRA